MYNVCSSCVYVEVMSEKYKSEIYGPENTHKSAARTMKHASIYTRGGSNAQTKYQNNKNHLI